MLCCGLIDLLLSIANQSAVLSKLAWADPDSLSCRDLWEKGHTLCLQMAFFEICVSPVLCFCSVRAITEIYFNRIFMVVRYCPDVAISIRGLMSAA